jgi:hypothetical protein
MVDKNISQDWELAVDRRDFAERAPKRRSKPLQRRRRIEFVDFELDLSRNEFALEICDNSPVGQFSSRVGLCGQRFVESGGCAAYSAPAFPSGLGSLLHHSRPRFHWQQRASTGPEAAELVQA